MYIDIKGIKVAFAEHMKKYRGYTEEEARIAVYDFQTHIQTAI